MTKYTVKYEKLVQYGLIQLKETKQIENMKVTYYQISCGHTEI